VIDEVQRRPDLFPVLRVLADKRPLARAFSHPRERFSESASSINGVPGREVGGDLALRFQP
jgi:hypothetical protein